MHELECQHLMNLARVVSITLEVTPDDRLESGAIEVRSAARSRVEKHLPNVTGQRVPVPNPEMAELVPSEKPPLEMQGGKATVQPGQPPRHAVVIGVRCLLQKPERALGQRRGQASTAGDKPQIRGNPRESRTPVRDQPERQLVALQRRLRRPIGHAHEVIIEEWRPQGQLGLLQREQPVVMPWSLAK